MSKVVTEEEFLEWCMRSAPPNSKLHKYEKDGKAYYHIGEPDLDLFARLINEMLKEQGKI